MNGTRSMLRVLLTLSLLAMPGCGSRSGLFALEHGDADASGIGGAPGGGGSSSGGAASGGSAGAGPCHALVPLVPTITPALVPADSLDDGLRLTATSDDGGRITAVFVRKSPTGTLALRHATLRPWQLWPTNGELAPIHVTGIETISSHVLARSGAERWATAVRTDQGLRVYRDLEPAADGTGTAPIAVTGIDPTFLVRGLAASAPHLLGTFDVGTEGQRLGAVLIDAAGTPKELPPLGCANGQAPRAGAVPFGEGWLVAYSRHAGTLKCPATGAGAPKQVDVLQVSPTGLVTTLANLDALGTVVDLQTAPHPLGLFVVWSSAPTAPEPGPGLRAVLVNADTGIAFGPFTLGAGDGGSFTTGAIGNQLVVARRRPLSGIDVSVYDDTFTWLASVTVETGGGSFPTALYGAPDGAGAVLGWTQAEGGNYQVRLTRLDCAP